MATPSGGAYSGMGYRGATPWRVFYTTVLEGAYLGVGCRDGNALVCVLHGDVDWGVLVSYLGYRGATPWRALYAMASRGACAGVG